MEEIKQELRQDNINVKCNAVAKLTYVSKWACSSAIYFASNAFVHNIPFLFATIDANARLRYILGWIQHYWSHELTEIHMQTRWLFGCLSMLSRRQWSEYLIQDNRRAVIKLIKFQICFSFVIAAPDVGHEYDTQRLEFTKSIRCWCCAQRTQLLYIGRFIAGSSKWYHDVGKHTLVLQSKCINWFDSIQWHSIFDEFSDELNQTVSPNEIGSHDVQGISTISRSTASRIPETQRETRRSRPRYTYPFSTKILSNRNENYLNFNSFLAGVQSAAVNVICELARKNPKNYLSLAPIFFKLMTTSTNNWMLIKIIKLVSSLRPRAF